MRWGDYDKGDPFPEGSDSMLRCKKSHSFGWVEALFAHCPWFLCAGSNGNTHTSTDKKILPITREISWESLSPRMVWGHLSQYTVETLRATLEVLAVGRALLLDGEPAPHVLGGLRPPQEE